MMYLYQVNSELSELHEAYANGEFAEYKGEVAEDGTVTEDAFAEQVKALFPDRKDLLENVARLTQNIDAEAAMIKAEEDRLKARRKATEERAERYRNILLTALEGKNYKSADTCLRVNITNSEALIVDDETAVRDTEFAEIRTSVYVDKVKAKKAIKNGAEVPGCHIEHRQSVTIK